jgi:ABC-type lipoprotein export system ATPase subunit
VEKIVELKNVSKTYKTGEKEFKALDSIDLSINKGELVVVLGPSGAGKSTLLNLIGGMDIPTKGDVLKNMINRFIENHKLSQSAHQEIMAMTHSDEDIAHFFQEHEIYMTDTIVKLLQSHGICSENLPEKVHISINLIDDLCHEIVYHKHKCMNYDVMIDLVVDTIVLNIWLLI